MFNKLVLSSIVLFAIFGGVLSNSCKNPQVSATSFTSSDATIVTHIAYIAEFTLKCSEPLPQNYALYAEVEGRPLTAAKTGENSYQVSWTEEVATAKSGSRQVELYDEDGWAAVRRARRAGETPRATLIVAIVVNHRGSYNGPWVNSEVLAASLSLVVAYIALRNKSKLLS